MTWLLNSLIESFLSFLMDLVGGFMELAIETFQNGFGASADIFNSFFPVGDIYTSFLTIGIILTVALFIFGIIRNFTSGLGFMGEEPVQMCIRFIVALIAVFFINGFMTYIYTWFDEVHETLAEATYLGTSSGFSIASDAMSLSKTAVLVLSIFLMLLVFWNFAKLLLEMIERYLMVNLLVFFSPLVASTITLSSTLKIFQSYVKMFAGQLILLLINSATLNIFMAGYSVATTVLNAGGDAANIDRAESVFSLAAYNFCNCFDTPTATILFTFLILIGYLKIAQRMDNYMRDIGLTVGITGGNLFDDVVVAGKMMGSAFKGIGKVMSSRGSSGKAGASGGPGGSGGKVSGWGAAQKAATFAAATTPLGMGFMAVKRGVDTAREMHAKGENVFGAEGVGVKKFAQQFASPITSLPGKASQAFANKTDIGQTFKGKMSAATPSGYAIGGIKASRLAGAAFSEKNMGDLGLNGADIRIGNGGMLYKDTAGNLNYLSQNKPTIGDYSQVIGNDGKNYYAQNLSEVQSEYRSQTGENYAPYMAAQRAMQGHSDDFSNINTAITSPNENVASISNEGNSLSYMNINASRPTTATNFRDVVQKTANSSIQTPAVASMPLQSVNNVLSKEAKMQKIDSIVNEAMNKTNNVYNYKRFSV